jgi:hypothetical protein
VAAGSRAAARMQRAIFDIALPAGFNSQAAFNSLFKKFAKK